MTIEAGESKPFELTSEPKKEHVDLFSCLDKEPDNEAPLDKALLVLATPRCGSTLFCEALNNTGKIGICEEWFNYDYFGAWAKVVGKTDFTFSEYLNWIYRKSIRNTGVWAIKWHIGQLVAMNSDFNLSLEAMNFDHVVYLYRRDKIAQAVSLAKAMSTDQFRSYHEATGQPNLSNANIADMLQRIAKFDQFTRQYLWKYVDASYAYEDFRLLSTPKQKADPSYMSTLTSLNRAAPGIRFTVSRLKKQGDSTNERAALGFRKYITGAIK